METSNLRVRYRPVRIGWCIRDNNWDDLRRALRLTHVFWGGKFNPLIPIGNKHTDKLIRKFRVDVLFNVADDLEIKTFVEGYGHLPWPLFARGLFTGNVPNFLDISHVIQKLSEEPSNENLSEHYSQFWFVRWEQNDPLRDVFLATFGALPSPDEIAIDYERYIADSLTCTEEKIGLNANVPHYLLDQTTIANACAMDLNWDLRPGRPAIGFYVGSKSRFEDIVNYWNLSACDVNVVFVDPDYLTRLDPLKIKHLEFIRQRQSPRGEAKGETPIWARLESQSAVQLAFSDNLPKYFSALDGVDVLPGNTRSPLQCWNSKSVLASLVDQYGKRSIAFQFPEKPISSKVEQSEQYFVVSIKSPMTNRDEANTFWVPYIPELNRWYGRELCLNSTIVRSEIEGVGVMAKITDDNLVLHSISKQELVGKLFEHVGIEANSSAPGRIASRLISQLGGLQGCRVLKIRGVRNLIKKHRPLEEFDRTEAIRTIGESDPATGQPKFQDFESLYIEARDPRIAKLKPEHAFQYLLDKGVFRVGLKLVCSICELGFWMSIDEVSTIVDCELCGGRFNVTRQLKDRAWVFRKSGLFGKENNQEGSIPVALTLQQLDSALMSLRGGSLFSTNVSLTPARENIEKCETDLFVAIGSGERIEILIGECKDAGGKIDLEDARKLAAVAESFPKDKFDVYILFSKTSAFSEQDIEHCRAAQPMDGGYRVIMLSDRELEPYRVYEWTAKKFEINGFASDLEDMARATHQIFFNSKSKNI